MKKILLILVVLVGVGAVGFGGWYAYGKISGKSNTAVGGVTPLANCEYKDKDLCKFLNNTKAMENYTMTAETAPKSRSKTKFVMKIENNQNSQLTSYEENKENFSSISLKEATYYKDYTDNKWIKVSSEKSTDLKTENLTEDIAPDVDSDAQKTTYKRIGEEACGKLKCLKYQVIDSTNTETTEYIWFDVKQYLLRKTRSETKDGSVTTTAFTYGKVSIKTPSPVKEGDITSIKLPALSELGEVSSESSTSSTPSTSNSSKPSSSDQEETVVPETEGMGPDEGVVPQPVPEGYGEVDVIQDDSDLPAAD